MFIYKHNNIIIAMIRRKTYTKFNSIKIFSYFFVIYVRAQYTAGHKCTMSI